MKFIVQPGLMLFSDDMPGAHATLFGPKGPLQFRDDTCSFDDAAHSYTWAFEYATPLKKGQVFVFATSDREVVGEVDTSGEVQVSDRKVKVMREENGKPFKFTKRLFR